MQHPPTAAELLEIVAEVLGDEVVPALTGPAQHHARVAANLVEILEREVRLGEANRRREHELLTALLAGSPGAPTPPVDALALRTTTAAWLRAGGADDPAVHQRTWDTLMAIVCDDLAVAKPGHDAWEGE